MTIKKLIDGSATMNLRSPAGKFCHWLYLISTSPFRIFGLELQRPLTLYDIAMFFPTSKKGIAEILSQTTSVLDDIPWMESPNPTGYRMN